MNDKAPTWMAIFRMNGNKAEPLREYTREELDGKPVKLPALSAGQYRLQGSFYFCKEGAGALCTIQSHDQAIAVGGGGAVVRVWRLG